MCTYTQKERKNKTIAFGNAKRIKAFLNAPKTKLKQYILTQQKTQKTKNKTYPKTYQITTKHTINTPKITPTKIIKSTQTSHRNILQKTQKKPHNIRRAWPTGLAHTQIKNKYNTKKT